MSRMPASLLLAVLAGASACGGDGATNPRPFLVHITTVVPDSLVSGDSLSLAAVVTDLDGRPRPDVTIAWQSSSVTVARVSPVGVVLGRSDGTATIRAVVRGGVDSVSVSVRVPVDSVVVIGVPASSYIAVGSSVQLTAEARDAAGHVLAGRQLVWTAQTAQASVSPTGLVTGLDDGAADLQVQSGLARTRVLFGVRAPVAAVVVGPPTVTLAPSESVTVYAAPRTAQGGLVYSRVVPVTSMVSTPAVLSANNGPLAAYAVLFSIHALAPGAGVVRFTAEGVTDSLRVTVAQLVLDSLSVGPGASCGLTSAGAAWCWGRNFGGQLGTGDTADRLTPAPVAGNLQFAGVVTGITTSCGWTTAGAAWCWGDGNAVSLGDGGLGQSLTPVPVASNAQFTQVALNWDTACGVTTLGEVYCWGNNADSVAGQPDVAVVTAPVKVPGLTGVVSVGVGDRLACALTAAGAAWCWGNLLGGDGIGSIGSAPVAVAGGHVFSQLSVGQYHACGLVAGGQAWCWGENSFGQLGDGSTSLKLSPVAVAGSLALSTISVGSYHTCGVDGAGQGWCWGVNSSGQFGDGGTQPSPVPTAAASGLVVTRIVAGAFHSCARTVTGQVYCWGFNIGGTVGGPAGPGTLVPVRVYGQL